jgi:hypothetical protein
MYLKQLLELLNSEQALLDIEESEYKREIEEKSKRRKILVEYAVNYLLPDIKRKTLKYLKHEVPKFKIPKKIYSFDFKKSKKEKKLIELRELLVKYFDDFEFISSTIETTDEIYIKDEVKTIDKRLKKIQKHLLIENEDRKKIIKKKIEAISKLIESDLENISSDFNSKLIIALNSQIEKIRTEGVNYKLCSEYIDNSAFPEDCANFEDTETVNQLEKWIWYNLLEKN